MQPWHTPFPIWKQSVVPCPVLTVASWPAYRSLKRQVRWSGVPISFRIFQFIVIHTVKGLRIVNKAETDVFLELSCLFNDPADVGNLISGSSAFSKTSLNIWKFTVHVLLKPGLENSGHYFTSMWGECNCAVVWAFFGIAFLWDWNESKKEYKCRFCSNFTKYYASVHNLFSYLIQNPTLYLVSLNSFSCMQQISVNPLFIFILLQIFSNFPYYGFLDTTII